MMKDQKLRMSVWNYGLCLFACLDVYSTQKITPEIFGCQHIPTTCPPQTVLLTFGG